MDKDTNAVNMEPIDKVETLSDEKLSKIMMRIGNGAIQESHFVSVKIDELRALIKEVLEWRSIKNFYNTTLAESKAKHERIIRKMRGEKG